MSADILEAPNGRIVYTCIKHKTNNNNYKSSKM